MFVKKLTALVLLLSALCLTGCGLSQAPSGGTDAPAENSPRTVVQFDTLTKGVGQDGTDLYYYTYPSVDVTVEGSSGAGEAVTADANAALAPGEADLSPVTEAAGAAYGALDEAGRRSWNRQGYGLDRSVELMRCDGRVLSIQCTESRMAGGPHPTGRSFGLTYDLRTGERITPETLAVNSGALTEAVREYILDAAANDPNSDSFYSLEEFAAGVLQSGEWYLSPDGLAVFASPEEIAPYAVGSVVFVIPYSELAGVIKDEYIPNSAPRGGEDALSLSQGPADGATVQVNFGDGAAVKLTAREAVDGLALTELAYDGEGGCVPAYPILYVSRLEAGESLGLTLYSHAGRTLIAYGLTYGSCGEATIALSQEGGFELTKP